MKTLFLVTMTTILISTGVSAQYGSRNYVPVSPAEKSAYDKSNRTVLPDDVRASFDGFRDTIIAWAGVIENVTAHEQEKYIELQFRCRHYYYDWIEDFGAQTEKIFLSSKGEGQIYTSWRLKKGTNVDQLLKETGDLLIIYGKPDHIENDAIYVNSIYIRLIGAKWFKHMDFVYLIDAEKRQRMEQHGR